MIVARTAGPEDVAAMLDVARSLPAWFNDGGLEEMTRDFAVQHSAVAEADGQVVGFVAWAPSPHTPEPGLLEMTWLGVRQEQQGQGVGRRLVAYLEEFCRAEGMRTLQVSTLADSVEYKPYEATRAFYRAVGFRDFRVDAGFYDGDDRLLLRKRVDY